jgi:hypothetical protein
MSGTVLAPEWTYSITEAADSQGLSPDTIRRVINSVES